jgi:class 3 adenylate cyclase
LKNIEALAEELSMTELVRLQDLLSKAIVRRFEKRLALAFSDVVGSTPYFARFGDQEGRKLQQRHYDFVGAAIAPEGGRVVDTAGDGVFFCFENVTNATRAVVNLLRAVAQDNDSRAADHRLNVRVGIHVGPVLTDGVLVSGDSVNFASRVGGSAATNELRLSAAAHAELSDMDLRMRGRREAGVMLKGVDKPHDLFTLEWVDASKFPTLVRFENGSEVRLPPLDVIRFGRLAERDGVAANDVVITLPDPEMNGRISRWHFELHRHSDGFSLRSVTASTTTEVNGKLIEGNSSVVVRPGTRVRVGGVMTLQFDVEDLSDDRTQMPTIMGGRP